MSGQELVYLVTQEFKYNDKTYAVGDYWEPDGGQFDSKIIENQTHVRTIDPNVETRRSRMTGHKYAAQIIAMKKKKMTYREIGAELNIHASTAMRIYKRAKEQDNA